MRPLNHKERNSLFWQFLFVFMATVLILLFALFYDFEMPERLSELERAEYNASKSFIRNQNRIAGKMESINSIIKRVESENNPEIPNKEAAEAIMDLKRIGASGDTTSNVLLQRIGDAYSGFLSAKYDLRRNKDTYAEVNNKINEYKSRISERDTKISQLQLENASLRTVSRNE